jgi:hypothetical protein
MNDVAKTIFNHVRSVGHCLPIQGRRPSLLGGIVAALGECLRRGDQTARRRHLGAPPGEEPILLDCVNRGRAPGDDSNSPLDALQLALMRYPQNEIAPPALKIMQGAPGFASRVKRTWVEAARPLDSTGSAVTPCRASERQLSATPIVRFAQLPLKNASSIPSDGKRDVFRRRVGRVAWAWAAIPALCGQHFRKHIDRS